MILGDPQGLEVIARAPRVLLLSTYDLGRQPFGLASPAAWLRRAGATVAVQDLAIQPLDEAAVRDADVLALHLPMYTATRLALGLIPRLRALAPAARILCYGLYAPLNAERLAKLGVEACIGGEFEAALVDAVMGALEVSSPRTATDPSTRQLTSVSLPIYTSPPNSDPIPPPRSAPIPLVQTPLARLDFIAPDRAGLPPLAEYAGLEIGESRPRRVGATEASRGCKHLCRHCPVVPVYQGRFRIVPVEVVLEDIRRQVAAGAEHISFGDPDFLNGPKHALAIARALHAAFPSLSWDATIKVEHLLAHADLLPELRAAGCVLITSAVESVDDAVLLHLDKGHRRADFGLAAALCREAGIALNPTFVAFHPWLSLDGYVDLLAEIARLGLAEQLAPVQLAIRLLIPAGSRLLELEEVAGLVEPFDPVALVHPWRHADPRVDALQRAVEAEVSAAAADGATRAESFARVWRLACAAVGDAERPLDQITDRAPLPYLTEPWYC